MSEVPSIETTFSLDHDRLDGLFANYQKWKAADFAMARDYFKEFRTSLNRHIVWEENLLFPLFEEKTGLSHTGPTEVLRKEHQQIKHLLDTFHDKIKVKDLPTEEEEHQLLKALAVHNQKEEAILYPLLDHHMTEDQKQMVFTLMENLPEETCRACCGHPQALYTS
jgi:iron-sulfur cluster repair protein YtfE (RIC family)